MNIVKINEDDISRIVPIFNAYRVHAGKKSNKEQANTFLYNNLKNKNATIFIAEEENDVIGFIQLYTMLSSMKMSQLLIINDLFVTEQARGKHVGEKLMNQAFQYGKENGYEIMYLETEKTNVAGNKLYQKLGMALDENHNYYSKPL